MRTLLTRLWILLGMVTATAAVTVIAPATAIATARLASNHNEVMASAQLVDAERRPGIRGKREVLCGRVLRLHRGRRGAPER